MEARVSRIESLLGVQAAHTEPAPRFCSSLDTRVRRLEILCGIANEPVSEELSRASKRVRIEPSDKPEVTFLCTSDGRRIGVNLDTLKRVDYFAALMRNRVENGQVGAHAHELPIEHTAAEMVRVLRLLSDPSDYDSYQQALLDANMFFGLRMLPRMQHWMRDRPRVWQQPVLSCTDVTLRTHASNTYLAMCDYEKAMVFDDR